MGARPGNVSVPLRALMNRIQDYALIGDCHSMALVGKDGSVDWACFPRFDSPSVFARVLDAERGGFFRICPVDEFQFRRSYIEATNVLVSEFETQTGILELHDLMPVGAFDSDRPAHVKTFNSILRRLVCRSGELRVRVTLAPRFEYGSFTPRLRSTSELTMEVVGGADALWVSATVPLKAGQESSDTVLALRAGDDEYMEVSWSDSFVERAPGEHPSRPDLERRYAETVGFWQEWSRRGLQMELMQSHLRRSALVLKALTYAPTGAVVAAPTTSLPEEIGGERNWDYRYTWIRDTTLTLISMLVLGYRPEADAFRQWLRRTSSGRAQDLQIMYGIDGRRSLPEIELSHLRGHRDSKPVRIGNGAVKQLQLDAYGSILQAVYVYARAGGTLTGTNWEFLRGLANIVVERWEKPDQGIWEIRDEPRHFIHSKLLCWVALDRALRIARERNLEGPTDVWDRERDRLFQYLTQDCARHGWFPQAVDRPEHADASCLLVPAMGLLPPNHPLVLETIARIRKDLERDGLVYRYLSTDGLRGHEGGFLLCSFWLLDALIHSGQLDQAEALLERLLKLENDVGLYAEEAVPESGEHLGNFPQAFTHMALITSLAHLHAARNGALPPEGEAYDFAEFALKYMRGPK